MAISLRFKHLAMQLGKPGCLLAAVMLASCGGSISPNGGVGGTVETLQLAAGSTNPPSEAASTDIVPLGVDAGVSPFIASIRLGGTTLGYLTSVEFTIAPRPASASAPVDVTYSVGWLEAQGYFGSEKRDSIVGTLQLPIFGLYSNYPNQVTLILHFMDGSVRFFPSVTVQTDAYVDPTGVYVKPTIVQARAAGTPLGYNFFMIKSEVGSPVIVDTDGQVRWVVPGVSDAFASAYADGEFVIGDPLSGVVHRVRIDGTVTSNPLSTTLPIEDFHHNMDPGRENFLAGVDLLVNGMTDLENVVVEMDALGNVTRSWDLASIISSYMQSQGDNPALFVRPGSDWFHENASTYDPRDDSIIVSSRENFVIKLDYNTGAIKWILGDTTKYWYTFPSLRAKALTLATGGLVPIGQHAVSITPDGLLLLFNDGLGSVSQPKGAPAGQQRSYSAVSAYSIDPVAMTAVNVWNFDDGQQLSSLICSSAYESSDTSVLVDFATADNFLQAHIMGLDPNHNVVFHLTYPTNDCTTAWNAIPIALEKLQIQ